jgi:hypothetical protein
LEVEFRTGISHPACVGSESIITTFDNSRKEQGSVSISILERYLGLKYGTVVLIQDFNVSYLADFRGLMKRTVYEIYLKPKGFPR